MTTDITPEAVALIAAHFDKRVVDFDNMTGACIDLRTARGKETRDYHEVCAKTLRALSEALTASQAETAAAKHGWDDQKARHHECWLGSVQTLYRALDAEAALQQSQSETAAAYEAAAVACMLSYPEDGTYEPKDFNMRDAERATVECCKYDIRALTPADSKAALERLIAEARKPYEEAYQYALNFADFIMGKHYHDNKDWRPQGELMGLMTQIDNMLAGVIAEARADALSGPWEDKPDALTAAVDATHPVYTKDYETYTEALELVSNRHSKGSLVGLVNYLLVQNKAIPKGDSNAKES
jgi:hypothetical protein